LRDVRLHGDRLEFGLVDYRGVLREFSGGVRGNLISGSVKAAGKPAGRFSARRVSVR
jgi:hypothetical protein